MLKSRLKFIFVFILIASLTIVATQMVSAHEVTSQPLVLVNGQDLLQDNPSPATSKLTSAEHIIDQNFSPGEAVQFRFNTAIAESELGFDASSLSIAWQTSDSQNFTGAQATIVFSQTGSYFISIIAKDAKQHLYDENILVTVGASIPAAGIQITQPRISVDPHSPIVQIVRSQAYTFGVTHPDTTKYTYTWDMGETDVVEGTTVTKKFTNTKLPVYIILREQDKATQVFADSYLRLEGNSDPAFSIVAPAIPRTVSANNSGVNSNVIKAAIGIIVVGLVGTLAFKLIQKSRRLRKRK